MQDKECEFEFAVTNRLEIEKLLSGLKCNKPAVMIILTEGS